MAGYSTSVHPDLLANLLHHGAAGCTNSFLLWDAVLHRLNSNTLLENLIQIAGTLLMHMHRHGGIFNRLLFYGAPYLRFIKEETELFSEFFCCLFRRCTKERFIH